MLEKQVTLVNPLPRALSHYELELRAVLANNGFTDVAVRKEPTAESVSPARRLVRAIQIISQRAIRDQQLNPLVVLWPLFGYLDALTWVRAARHRRVVLVLHDIRPLRKQWGHSKIARLLFRLAVTHSHIIVVCHTPAAGEDLLELTGVDPVIAAHPLLPPLQEGEAKRSSGDRAPIRVMGQYKAARSMDALVHIGAEPRLADVEKVITGRGWPLVDGWRTDNRFVSEGEFEELLRTAACVVIPYRHFYQSGILIRCFESDVPVVVPRHPQSVAVLGEAWPGLVDDDWALAATKAISADRDAIRERHHEVFIQATRSWQFVIDVPVADGPLA